MRALLFTIGSPFARGVRIILDELGLDYERWEEITTPSAEARAAATPTLQVPTLWDGDLTLWESGTIAEYLVSSYPDRPNAVPPLAGAISRSDAVWRDKLVFATIQTFGTAATTISQMTWNGIGVGDSAHLARSAEKLTHILGWLEGELGEAGDGFIPGVLSVQDIFLGAHVGFVAARPLGISLPLSRTPKVAALLERVNARPSFRANPVWWWEPGVTGYRPDGTPVFGGKNG